MKNGWQSTPFCIPLEQRNPFSLPTGSVEIIGKKALNPFLLIMGSRVRVPPRSPDKSSNNGAFPNRAAVEPLRRLATFTPRLAMSCSASVRVIGGAA
jgi:hypothetical protein